MKYSEMSKTKYLFYILFHPVTGFEELKFNHKGSYKIANLLCLLFCLAVVIKQTMCAFLFRENRIEDVNIVLSIAGCIGMLGLISISNWLFCTLLEGKGKLGEIWIVCCYSMLPYIMISIPLTFLGNFFTIEESFFYTAMNILLISWSALLMFVGLMAIHQFSISKNILTILFTVIGIMIILFLLLLIFTLLRNVYTFFVTVYNELSFRV